MGRDSMSGRKRVRPLTETGAGIAQRDPQTIVESRPGTEGWLDVLVCSDELRHEALANLGIPPEQAERVIRNWRVVGPALSGGFRRRGFKNKTAWIRSAAKAEGLHENRAWQIIQAYCGSGCDPRELGRRPPGPPKGTGSTLTDEMRELVTNQRRQGKSVRACHAALVECLEAKGFVQERGLAMRLPSYSSVKRFVRSLPRPALAKFPETGKSARQRRK
jgi:hypothetical protein